MPVAPGSFGALFGLGIHALVWALCDDIATRVFFLSVALLVVSAVHFAITDWSVKYWQNKDPKNFVLDEVAGYLLVPLLHPFGPPLRTAIIGFLLFRVLDVIKIPPAKQIDRDMPGAWGILLDDVVSAIYAAGLLYGLDFILRS
ncbi:MAG: phosphatidylglycerophosphatase A [bacterium]|nr:phosphatidylglycerophosphatase A [bacterium]